MNLLDLSRPWSHQYRPGRSSRVESERREASESKMSHPCSDRQEMKRAQRDSPEEPCTRASRSPEGEVHLFRDFPGGNQKGGLQGPPGMNCPTCPLLFSGLGLRLCPPTLSPSTVPQPLLDLQSKALRPSPLCSLTACSGLQARQMTDRQGFTGRPHLTSTSHTWSFSHSSFLCSRADCQPLPGLQSSVQMSRLSLL